MERLTGTDKEGAYLLACRQEPCKDLKGNCSSCGYMQEALVRLAEYEALEVALEQVKEMDVLFGKKCEEVHKLKKDNDRLNSSLAKTKEALEKVVQAIWESVEN